MENVTLSYYQIMCFMYRFYEIERLEGIINNQMLNQFRKTFMSKSITMFMKSPIIFHETLKYLKIFEISIAGFNYLINLTSINPLNKDELEKYKNKIKDTNFEEEFLCIGLKETRQYVKNIDKEQKQQIKNYAKKLKRQAKENSSKKD